MKCSYCDATIHCKKGVEVVECSHCGERMSCVDVVQESEMNLKFENAKSLRSIAMSLQAFGLFQIDGYSDQCDLIGPLDG